MSTVQQIKDAIMTLTSEQREELYQWIDHSYSTLFDARIEADIAAGRLDSLISGALEDQRNGRLKPL